MLVPDSLFDHIRQMMSDIEVVGKLGPVLARVGK